MLPLCFCYSRQLSCLDILLHSCSYQRLQHNPLLLLLVLPVLFCVLTSSCLHLLLWQRQQPPSFPLALDVVVQVCLNTNSVLVSALLAHSPGGVPHAIVCAHHNACTHDAPAPAPATPVV